MARRIFVGAGPLVVLLALALAPVQAHAANDDAEQRARAYFREGQIHFDLARFEEALEAFGKAYETLPLPAFLFNIGQCHRALGDHARAIHFFRGYLRGTPDAPNREAVEQLIAESEEALARARDERPPEKAPDESPDGGEAVVAVGPAHAGDADSAPPDAIAVTSPPPAVERPITGRWWFWAAVGAAVVGGTAAAVAASSGGDLPEGSLGVVDWR